MISLFGINTKKYSDLPLTYAPATGFKWTVLYLYIASSDTAMTAHLRYYKTGNVYEILLATTTSEYLDATSAAAVDRYSDVVISSLDSLEVLQTGGVAGDTVTAIIEVEVLPA